MQTATEVIDFKKTVSRNVTVVVVTVFASGLVSPSITLKAPRKNASEIVVC